MRGSSPLRSSRKKNNKNRKGSCTVVAWEVACRPKSKMDLALSNLKTQNNVLLKLLDKFCNHADFPWVNSLENVYTNRMLLLHMLQAQLAPSGGGT